MCNIYIYVTQNGSPILNRRFGKAVPDRKSSTAVSFVNSVDALAPQHWRCAPAFFQVRSFLTDGKITMFFMGKYGNSTISTGQFSIANCKRLPEGNSPRN